jgi:hypothetical protein
MGSSIFIDKQVTICPLSLKRFERDLLEFLGMLLPCMPVHDLDKSLQIVCLQQTMTLDIIRRCDAANDNRWQ